MKHSILISIFFSMLCGAGAVPEIQFDKDTVDFGVNYKNGYTNGAFIFHNVGDQPLVIKKAEPDCGCTDARVLPETISPGESGKVSFKLRLTDVDGAAKKGITVFSNDPKKPSVKLTISAETKRLFYTSPEQLNIEALPPGYETNFVVTVQRADGQKIFIDKVNSSDRSITADVDNQSDPQGLTANMWIHLKGKPEGSFQSYLLVYADKDTLPSFFFNINGKVLPNVNLTPANLFWGIAHPDQWSSTNSASIRTIEVTANRPGDVLKISRVTSTIPNLVMQVGAGSSTTKATITATMLNLPVQSISGEIKVELDSPKHEVLNLPVKIEIHG